MGNVILAQSTPAFYCCQVSLIHRAQRRGLAGPGNVSYLDLSHLSWQKKQLMIPYQGCKSHEAHQTKLWPFATVLRNWNVKLPSFWDMNTDRVWPWQAKPRRGNPNWQSFLTFTAALKGQRSVWHMTDQDSDHSKSPRNSVKLGYHLLTHLDEKVW